MRRASASTWKRLKLVLALLGLAGILLVLPSRFTAPARVLFNEAAGPLETAVFQQGGKALAATGTLADIFLQKDRERALSGEVEKLQNENAALSDEALRLRDALHSVENLSLKGSGFRALRAPLSSYDVSAMRHSITVRAGSRDGVRRGLAVTAEGALIGVVRETGPSECRVQLITDPESSIACRVSRTRTLCILQGTGGEVCRAEWLDRDSFVEQGDVLVTTTLRVNERGSPQVPEGLPAATVISVRSGDMHPLFLSVEAAPRVNVRRLEGVEVLVPQD
jgi:rod shape-determining protein MreC